MDGARRSTHPCAYCDEVGQGAAFYELAEGCCRYEAPANATFADKRDGRLQSQSRPDFKQIELDSRA